MLGLVWPIDVISTRFRHGDTQLPFFLPPLINYIPRGHGSTREWENLRKENRFKDPTVFGSSKFVSRYDGIGLTDRWVYRCLSQFERYTNFCGSNCARWEGDEVANGMKSYVLHLRMMSTDCTVLLYCIQYCCIEYSIVVLNLGSFEWFRVLRASFCNRVFKISSLFSIILRVL